MISNFIFGNILIINTGVYSDRLKYMSETSKRKYKFINKIDYVSYKNIDQIVEASIRQDVFVHNAFHEPPDTKWACYAQVNLLQAVYKRWKELNKKGWIFNI